MDGLNYGVSNSVRKAFAHGVPMPGRTLTVGPNNANFATIKDAIAAAVALGCAENDPVEIQVATGYYQEDNSTPIALPRGILLEGPGNLGGALLAVVAGTDPTKPIFVMDGVAFLSNLGFAGNTTAEYIRILDWYASVVVNCMFLGGFIGVACRGTGMGSWNATVAWTTFTGLTGPGIAVDALASPGSLQVIDCQYYSYGASVDAMSFEATSFAGYIENFKVFGPCSGSGIIFTGDGFLQLTGGQVQNCATALTFTPAVPGAQLVMNGFSMGGNTADLTTNANATITMVGGFMDISLCSGLTFGGNFNGSFFDASMAQKCTALDLMSKDITSINMMQLTDTDSLPVADASSEGEIRLVKGGVGTRSTLKMCLKSDAGVYAWIDVVDGGA